MKYEKAKAEVVKFDFEEFMVYSATLQQAIDTIMARFNLKIFECGTVTLQGSGNDEYVDCVGVRYVSNNNEEYDKAHETWRLHHS